MPRGDGTGPLGQGPMTGRAAGRCAGNDAPGYVSAGAGRGMRQGRGGAGGGGRGRGRRFSAAGMPRWMRFGWGRTSVSAPVEPDAEKQLLQAQVDTLQTQLEAIQKRIEAMAGHGVSEV